MNVNWHFIWSVKKGNMFEASYCIFEIIWTQEKWTQKKLSTTHTKEFCEKNAPKSPVSEEFFSEITLFSQ
jgi:hypothetical protein